MISNCMSQLIVGGSYYSNYSRKGKACFLLHKESGHDALLVLQTQRALSNLGKE